MTILVLAAAIGCMLAIRPALAHDRLQRVEVTGNIIVHHPDRTEAKK